eukprot:tig00021517_g21992.t1
MDAQKVKKPKVKLPPPNFDPSVPNLVEFPPLGPDSAPLLSQIWELVDQDQQASVDMAALAGEIANIREAARNRSAEFVARCQDLDNWYKNICVYRQRAGLVSDASQAASPEPVSLASSRSRQEFDFPAPGQAVQDRRARGAHTSGVGADVEGGEFAYDEHMAVAAQEAQRPNKLKLKLGAPQQLRGAAAQAVEAKQKAQLAKQQQQQLKKRKRRKDEDGDETGATTSASEHEEENEEEKAARLARESASHPFWAQMNPIFNLLREQDLNLLQFKEWSDPNPDAYSPLPPLGKHYVEQWREEDEAFYGGVDPLHQKAAPPPPDPFEVPVRGEALTQRLLAAFVEETCPSKEDMIKEEDDDMDSVPETTMSGMATPGHTDALMLDEKEALFSLQNCPACSAEKITGSSESILSLEQRLRRELIQLGLLEQDEEITEATREDDEICIEIRRTQEELRKLVSDNQRRCSELRASLQQHLETEKKLAMIRKADSVFDKEVQKLLQKQSNQTKKKGDGDEAKGAAKGASASAEAAKKRTIEAVRKVLDDYDKAMAPFLPATGLRPAVYVQLTFTGPGGRSAAGKALAEASEAADREAEAAAAASASAAAAAVVVPGSSAPASGPADGAAPEAVPVAAAS